ncbi:MAG: hypothetical protein JSR77_04270 [Planctomycetes bacterium]|nr:hypothetical protein [Planctomycetota bacterium]
MFGHITRSAVAAIMLAATAHAQLSVFSDRSAFLAASQAQAGPEWPNLGQLPGGVNASYSLGGITLSVSSPSSGLWIGSGNHPLVGPDWTTLVPGNDIAIDGPENLNAQFDGLLSAVGFDFAEPTTVTVRYNPCSVGCPCANSTFRVTLRRAGVAVASFDYNRPDDTAAFVGVISPVAFDRFEVREMGGTCDDEYFGRFYTATCVTPTISLQPVSITSCPTETVTLATEAAGTGPLTYQWQIEDEAAPGGWKNLEPSGTTCGGLPIGSATFDSPGTVNLTISEDLRRAPAPCNQPRLRCIATGPCGQMVTQPATLTVCACLACPADFNLDGGIDGTDVSDFFASWESGHCDADANADGGIDGSDVSSFYGAWEAGGC